MWHKLRARFGFDFYITFISLSASDQVNSLLSGFCDLLNVESDRVDSMKIFLMTLKLFGLGAKLRYMGYFASLLHPREENV